MIMHRRFAPPRATLTYQLPVLIPHVRHELTTSRNDLMSEVRTDAHEPRPSEPPNLVEQRDVGRFQVRVNGCEGGAGIGVNAGWGVGLVGGAERGFREGGTSNRNVNNLCFDREC